MRSHRSSSRSACSWASPPTRATRACGPAPATRSRCATTRSRRSTCRPRCRRRACRIARPRSDDRLPSAAEGDIPKGGAPAIAPAPVPTGLPDLDELRGRRLAVPVEGIDRKTLRDSFAEGRTGHVHEAIDILAPRGTPVVAVEDGRIEKLFTSKQGGLTIYQFDPSRRYCYYYAHLDRYAAGLTQGQAVKRGQVIGYVGISGNAPPKTPHLHFTIFKLAEDKRWWKGAPINPFPLWAAS